MHKLVTEKKFVYFKKNISILFNKIEIKFHLNLNNETKHPMSLELLRKEIQILILTTILKDLKLCVINISQSPRYLDYSKDKIDILIILILLSSKRKIINKLKFAKEDYLYSEKIENNWLLKVVETEDYSSSILMVKVVYQKLIYCKVPAEIYPSKLLGVLLENLIIKLSNFIAYEVFFNLNLPTHIAKNYFRDYSLIDYNNKRLHNYFYWKFYITLIFFNIKNLYEQTHYLVLLQKKGFSRKKLYNSELNKTKNLSKIEIILLGCIGYIDFIFPNILLAKK